jgi:hypothetical protein
MHLSKIEFGFQNFTFQLQSDTQKNGCFTAKQAPEVRFKVLTVVLLTSLLGT